MMMELDEQALPATVRKNGSREYHFTGGEKLHIRSKEGANWVNDLQFVAAAKKATRVVVTVHMEEV